MALNIPVNLMNTSAPPLQTATNSGAAIAAVTTIQPTTSSAGSSGNAFDGGGLNKGRSEQHALMLQQRTTQPATKTPTQAEPESIVAAQTQPETALQQTATELPQTSKQNASRQSELDRYAPPNPLPTAPILQLAASYAALTAKPD
ncbi:hypothetical protein [uncultured Sulfitobacter sp.]|uniref:hypothetical protein n=1 Tax=uncultured Sulfitobacter sp. TaxID=191468 RepID=UPI002632C2D0|nr:hypothetical protein [uncultured Sulfitobacter sp.]